MKIEIEKYESGHIYELDGKFYISFDVDKMLKDIKNHILNTKITDVKNKKPPLGLIPKKIKDEERLLDICEAIARYISVNKKIPPEWLKEYNELTEIEKLK